MPSATPELDAPAIFDAPFIHNPPIGTHQHSFIILHDRGSYPASLSRSLLDIDNRLKTQRLQDAFPYAKIIFPISCKTRATNYKKALSHQWFDSWHVKEDLECQGLMMSGLHESVQYIHKLLEAEIKLVGSENVVLWGMGQGGATSLASLLMWNKEPFAAVVGMCSYLPFSNVVEEILSRKLVVDNKHDSFSHSGDDKSDPFAVSDGMVKKATATFADSNIPSHISEAINFLPDKIGVLKNTSMAFRNIPIFFGHGTEDEEVPITRVRETASCLKQVGATVRTIEYQALGHRYSDDMLRDICEFLNMNLGEQRRIRGRPQVKCLYITNSK